MNWFKLKGTDDAWSSPPYRIYRNVLGYDLWLYGKTHGVIGRGIGSLALAQQMAEVHKAKHARTKD